jgi:hypothetical protein
LAIRVNTVALTRDITIRRRSEALGRCAIAMQPSPPNHHRPRDAKFTPTHTATARSHCRDLSAPPAAVEVLAKQVAFGKTHPLISIGTEGV